MGNFLRHEDIIELRSKIKFNDIEINACYLSIQIKLIK